MQSEVQYWHDGRDELQLRHPTLVRYLVAHVVARVSPRYMYSKAWFHLAAVATDTQSTHVPESWYISEELTMSYQA